MKQSRGNKRWASIAMLFGAVVTALLLPAYGQQEVDPTWYNPWPAPAVVVHSAQPEVASHRHQPALRRVSTAQGVRKSHGKQPATTEVTMAHLTK